MRIDINLASQKYEDARQFYLRFGTALALTTILTLGLAFLAWSNYKNTSSDRRHIKELKDRIAKLDQERLQAEAVLNRPENQDVRDQNNFWNYVIYQRAFSWTQVFSDLERVIPARAYVLSVQPTLTPEGRLQLHLLVAGENHDNALELVSKMERSERFHAPTIRREGPHAQAQSLQGPAARTQSIWEFEIEAFYTPAPQVQQAASAAKAGM